MPKHASQKNKSRAMFILGIGVSFSVIFAIAYSTESTTLKLIITAQLLGLLSGVIFTLAGLAMLLQWQPMYKIEGFSSLLLNLSLSSFTLLLALSAVELILPSINQFGSGLLLPPNQRLEYTTIEFSIVVNTNSPGFRGEETSILPQHGTCRIVAVGDSFTYGWGVENNETWAYMLAGEFATLGIDNVEVLNLGHPGWGPSEYVFTVHQARRLHPDLVIIAVLQQDDLNQSSRPVRFGVATGYLFRFTNIRHFVKERLINTNDQEEAPDTIRDSWRQAIESIRAEAVQNDSDFFDQLDEDVRKMYFSGNLNPGLAKLAMRRPDYLTSILDPAQTQSQVNLMGDRFSRIRDELGKTPGLIVSVPYRNFTEQYLNDLSRIGFNTSPALLTSPAPDVSIQSAAEIAGLPFYSPSEQFHQYPQDERLFYEYDGHFNQLGHRVYAQALARTLLPEVETICGR